MLIQNLAEQKGMHSFFIRIIEAEILLKIRTTYEHTEAEIQRDIQNPVKHLRWNYLQKVPSEMFN